MLERILTVFLLVALVCLLGGCWSCRELSELAIVLGAGIDLVPNGLIRVSVQIARPGAFYGGAEGGGKGTQPSSWVVHADGRTVQDAVTYLSAGVSRRIYWSHCMVLVIGEEMARHGVRMVEDFFSRDREPRETMWVVVAEGTAQHVLEAGSLLEKTSAQAAAFLTRMREGMAVQLREFVEMLSTSGVEPVATRVVVRGMGVAPGTTDDGEDRVHKQVEVDGLALFKDDKLVGWFDEQETEGFLWVKGRAVGTTVIVEFPSETGKAVAVKIRQSRTRVVPHHENGRVRFQIMIATEGDVVEQQVTENLATPERIAGLRRLMAEEVKRRVTVALEKAQKQYGTDVFGFGQAFHRRYKKEWQSLWKIWDEVFAEAETEVLVDANIRETGMLTKRPSTSDSH